MAEQQVENKIEEKVDKVQEEKGEEVKEDQLKGDDKAGEDTKEEAAPQLSEKELQQMQKVKEENKNPYIATINKRIKALGKKIKNIEKLEEQRKSGKELIPAQIESINSRKIVEKEMNHFEELKKSYLVVWEQQRINDPIKLLFQLFHGITVELKAPNQKFAPQTERLNKFKERLLTEPATFMEFPSAVNNSNTLFQKFTDSSEEIAFDEVTFKQLRTDLQEVTSAITGLVQFKLHEQEKKKKQEQRLKEKEEKKKDEETNTKVKQDHKKEQPTTVGVAATSDKKDKKRKNKKKTNTTNTNTNNKSNNKK